MRKPSKNCDNFVLAFIPRDIMDQAHQTLYSLSLELDCGGNFNDSATTFRLAQAQRGISADNILIDTLQ